MVYSRLTAQEREPGPRSVNPGLKLRPEPCPSALGFPTCRFPLITSSRRWIHLPDCLTPSELMLAFVSPMIQGLHPLTLVLTNTTATTATSSATITITVHHHRHHQQQHLFLSFILCHMWHLERHLYRLM